MVHDGNKVFRLIQIVVGLLTAVFLLSLLGAGAVRPVLGLIAIGALIYGALYLLHWVVVERPKTSEGEHR